jgi:hypothetical protein
MKKLMMIAAFMVAAVSANAQGEVGSFSIQPKIGMNLASVVNAKKNDEGVKSKTLVGLVAGIEAEYVVANKFSLALGALYSKQGCGFKFEAPVDYDHFSLDYLNIPIVANYYIIPGLAIKAGIQPSFMLGAKNKFKINALGGTMTRNDNIKNNFKTFDLAIPLGASYEYKNVVFDVRYNLSVLKLNKNKDFIVNDVKIAEFDKNLRNSVIQFTLGYKIPVK